MDDNVNSTSEDLIQKVEDICIPEMLKQSEFIFNKRSFTLKCECLIKLNLLEDLSITLKQNEETNSEKLKFIGIYEFLTNSNKGKFILPIFSIIQKGSDNTINYLYFFGPRYILYINFC